ncbi:MAG: group II intron reverse transcriptase/maturase, partial [Desulfobacterales bacterium]
MIESRLAECQLELHPEKTKIVYCKDQIRRGNYPNEKFDFLGFTFRARTAVGRNGTFFVSFLPAVSDQAVKSIRAKIKSSRLIAYSTPQAVQPMG